MRNLRRAVVACAVVAVACIGLYAAPAGAVEPAGGVGWIDVSIPHQRVYVYARNGGLLREIPVSTGAGGRTPLGHFRVYSRSAVTSSTTDARVTMKWMTRFDGGIGFHGIPHKGKTPLSTPLGQRAVSHGCVRMADSDAAFIYYYVPNGTPVNVIPK
jgi:lipoprotein-anchoring transpeptidase ErfK/SrfK